MLKDVVTAKQAHDHVFFWFLPLFCVSFSGLFVVVSGEVNKGGKCIARSPFIPYLLAFLRILTGFRWWAQLGSNQRPRDYESPALTN